MRKRIFTVDRLPLVLCGVVSFLLGLGLQGEAVASKELKKSYQSIIQSIALKHGVDAELVHSVIAAESNYDPWAVSPKGALGLMQLMPDTAKQYGVKNTFDPAQNIEGGVKYLKDLIRLFNSKTKFVLAAYNAGQEAVKKFKGIPPYQETRNYILRVMASYNKPFIRNGAPVFKYYDETGKAVLTNDPYYLGKKAK
jgi:soluble lytic murein transglycosylase-like protein